MGIFLGNFVYMVFFCGCVGCWPLLPGDDSSPRKCFQGSNLASLSKHEKCFSLLRLLTYCKSVTQWVLTLNFSWHHPTWMTSWHEIFLSWCPFVSGEKRKSVKKHIHFMFFEKNLWATRRHGDQKKEKRIDFSFLFSFSYSYQKVVRKHDFSQRQDYFL